MRGEVKATLKKEGENASVSIIGLDLKPSYSLDIATRSYLIV